MARHHNPLAGLPVFAGLSERVLEHAQSLLTPVDLPAGSLLTVEGRYGQEAFLILDGEAEVIRDGEVVATVGRGALVGEVALLSPQHRRTATVQARTPVSAMVMSPREFDSLRALPGIDEEFRRIAAKHMPHDDPGDQ